MLIETELVTLMKRRGVLREKRNKLKTGSKTWNKLEAEITELTEKINSMQDPR